MTKEQRVASTPTKPGVNFKDNLMLKPGSKVYGIIRVSTKKQVDKTSLLSQEKSIRMYCKYKKYDLVRIYKEPGRSAFGTLEKRKELQQMMEDAQYDGITGIVFYDLTRATRNPKEYYRFKEWLKEKDISMEFVTQVFTADPEGELIEDVLVRIARYQSQKIGEKAKLGMEARIKQGIHMGRLPFGYERDKKTKLQKPNKYHKFVVKAWKMYLARKTVSEIYEYLKKNNVKNYQGKPVQYKRVSQMLSTQAFFYAGYIRYKGKTYKGAHKRILSPREYAKLDRVIYSSNLKLSFC